MKSGIGLYLKNSKEAVELYLKAFDLKLGYHVLNPDGSYYYSELVDESGKQYFTVDESAESTGSQYTVQVNMILDGEDEVMRAYELLAVGGKIDTAIGPMPWSPCAACVTDRFGVWWYISAPQHSVPDDFDPSKA